MVNEKEQKQVPCVAALDVGTTAVKVCLFDERFHLLRVGRREYPLRFTQDGRAEAEADIYLSAIREAFREALAGEVYDIRALGLTTQGETLVATDAMGQPLTPFIVWLDGRAEEQAKGLKERIGEESFFQETGLPALDGALPLAKVMWIRKELPDLQTRIRHILLLEDYLLWWMTGVYATEKALQTSTGWFSLRQDGYSMELLGAADVPPEWLPELKEPGEGVGSLRPEAADILGIPAGIPVAAGAMDQVAAAYGMGCMAPGMALETTGTAQVVSACVETLNGGGKPLTIYRHVTAGKYLTLGIGNTGGRALTWLRDLCFPGMNYDDLCALAEKAPSGSGGVTFLPFLSGLVDPDHAPEAKGCFWGMTLGTTPGDLARAVMEGVTCQTRDLVRRAEERGCRVERLISLGGGADSPLWGQIKANLCGLPLEVPDHVEAAARGAAMLAAKGARLPWQADELNVRWRFEPQEREASEAIYARYRRLYDALLPLNHTNLR